jgi:hypothetical protein
MKRPWHYVVVIATVIAGPMLVGGSAYIVSWLVPPSHQAQAWPLCLWSVGGFVGAGLGSWGLRHRLGWLYGVGLGLLVGVPLCAFHGGLAFVGGEVGCIPLGDHWAGLLFGLTSALGGLAGTRFAGVRPGLFVAGPRRAGAWPF